jgi:integrase
LLLAAIQKIVRKKGIVYRVQIRRKNSKIISKTFTTKKLAQQFASRLESDKQTLLAFGGLTNNTVTLKEVVDRYLKEEYSGKHPKEQTMKLDFWISNISDKPLSEVITIDISSPLNELSRHLSNATVNRYKAAISVVFSYACREYGLLINPVKNIRSKPENNERIRFLSDEERPRLFKACRTSQWSKLHLLVLMAITTGARKSELLNLTFNDIDFDRQTAYVQTSKNGQPRVLPLTNEVITELNKFRNQEASLIFNSELKPDRPMCFNKQWKKALTQAKITDFRYHDLRHSCASLLAQSGASLLEIAEILGHKQIQVTKRYAHLCIDHKSKLINKVMGNI